MGELDQAIEQCVEIFVKNCGKDSDCLNMSEFKAMMEKEVDASNYKGKLMRADLTEAFDRLDKNKDEEINIQEYSRFISILMKAYYRKKYNKGGKGGRGAKRGGKGEDADED
ncbi:protein S100-A6-like [Vanacampus margaritifer]